MKNDSTYRDKGRKTSHQRGKNPRRKGSFTKTKRLEGEKKLEQKQFFRKGGQLKRKWSAGAKKSQKSKHWGGPNTGNSSKFW